MPSGSIWTRPVVEEGYVIATCWCDRLPVHVTLADVLAGRTYSCGMPGCVSPQGDGGPTPEHLKLERIETATQRRHRRHRSTCDAD